MNDQRQWIELMDEQEWECGQQDLVDEKFIDDVERAKDMNLGGF